MTLDINSVGPWIRILTAMNGGVIVETSEDHDPRDNQTFMLVVVVPRFVGWCTAID
jgi:hypothetical protein